MDMHCQYQRIVQGIPPKDSMTKPGKLSLDYRQNSSYVVQV